jgi:hypothetical protein
MQCNATCHGAALFDLLGHTTAAKLWPGLQRLQCAVLDMYCNGTALVLRRYCTGTAPVL